VSGPEPDVRTLIESIAAEYRRHRAIGAAAFDRVMDADFSRRGHDDDNSIAALSTRTSSSVAAAFLFLLVPH
jgi:hypothetical protein